MMLFAALLAFGMPGYQEMLVILILGLLVLGRRLPEVGRTLGRTVAQLRRGIADFKTELRQDEDLQEARSAVRDLKKAVEVPRTLANPKRLLTKVAKDALREADDAQGDAKVSDAQKSAADEPSSPATD